MENTVQKYNMPMIKSVVACEDYRVLVELSNGHAIILDMECKLNTIRFSMLSNKDIFKKVYTDGFSVLWQHGVVRLNFAEIIQMLQRSVLLSVVA